MTYPGREATLGTILAIIAFGLLLVVNISTPIVKTLYLVKITRSDLASEEELTIGLWGYCGQNEGESKKCTSSKVGFAFDARRALNPNLIGTSDSLPSAPNTTLSYLVVVHIVALITLSIVTCVGGCAHTRKNRDRGLIGIAAQSSALAFILVLIAFIIDFIIFKQGIVNPINERVGSVYSAKVDVSFYLIIACLISSGLGTIGFFIGRIMNKQRRKKEEQEIFDDKEMNENIYSEPRNEDTYSEPRNEDQNQNVPTYCEYEEDVASYSPPSIHTPLPDPEYPNLSFSSGSQHGREYNLSIPPQPGKFSNPPYQPRIQNPPQPYSMGPSVRPLPPSPPVTQHQFYPQPSSYPNAYRSYSTTSPSMYPQDHYSQDHYPQDRYPQDHYPQDNYPQDNYNQPPYDLNSNIYNNQYEYPPKSSHRDQTQPPDNYYER